MLRVLGTIQNSQYKNAFKNEIKALKDWVNEIHEGMYNYVVRPYIAFRASNIRLIEKFNSVPMVSSITMQMTPPPSPMHPPPRSSPRLSTEPPS